MLITNLQPTIIPTIDIRIRNTYPLEKDSPWLLLRGFCGKFFGTVKSIKKEKNRSKRSLNLMPDLEISGKTKLNK